MDATKQASKGRRILNDGIREDFARLLEMIADPRDDDLSEVERIAGKYRFYFDENGELCELHPKGGR